MSNPCMHMAVIQFVTLLLEHTPMKATRFLAALALMGSGLFANAQATTPEPAAAKTIYVYMVAKQDAQHLLISEVMEATELMRQADLVNLFHAKHPDTPTPYSMESLRFATKEEADLSRTTLKAKYEKTGKNVTML